MQHLLENNSLKPVDQQQQKLLKKGLKLKESLVANKQRLNRQNQGFKTRLSHFEKLIEKVQASGTMTLSVKLGTTSSKLPMDQLSKFHISKKRSLVFMKN